MENLQGKKGSFSKIVREDGQLSKSLVQCQVFAAGVVCFNITRSVWFSRVSWVEYVLISPGACGFHVFPG